MLCSDEISVLWSREASHKPTFSIRVLGVHETLSDGHSLGLLKACEEIVLGCYLGEVGSIL